jgi:transposase-like protein
MFYDGCLSYNCLSCVDLEPEETIMDDLDMFCCQNKECSEYGIRGEKNIRVRSRYGANDTRLLYCLICKKTFSEHRGTVFFDARLPKETVISILEHVVEGTGMRKTGRLLKVDHDTVSRYTKLAGEHAEQLHDELVAFSPEHRGDSIRREVGLRAKEAEKLRRKQSG